MTGSRRPLVSIVTPTLNRERLLEHTLRSVRNQSYPHIEHIVVDGRSTDGTIDLLRRYEGSYRLRWQSEPDDGMYQAINRGLTEASGEILAYLNSDDLYLPWAVEVVVSHFARHPDADIVYGAAIDIDDRSARQSLNFQVPFDTDYIRRYGFLCQPAVFWTRRVMEEEGVFDTRLRYVADCDYWMRLADRRKFRKLNEFVAVQRNHNDTLRSADATALAAELVQVRARYVQLDGWRHRLAVVRHRVRDAFTWRAYWFAFALQSAIPPRLRREWWRRLIDSRHFQVRWRYLGLKLVPGISQRRPRVIRPSRYWLEPNEQRRTDAPE